MSKNSAQILLKKGLMKYGELEVDNNDIDELLSKYSIIMSYDIKGVNFQRLREAIEKNGDIFEENEEQQCFLAIIRTGALRMARALVSAAIIDGNVQFAAYAREGLIKQHLCQKAIASIKNAL